MILKDDFCRPHPWHLRLIEIAKDAVRRIYTPHPRLHDFLIGSLHWQSPYRRNHGHSMASHRTDNGWGNHLSRCEREQAASGQIEEDRVPAED